MRGEKDMEVEDALREVKESYSAMVAGAPWISDALRCAIKSMEKGIGKPPEEREGTDWLGNKCTEYRCPKCEKRIYMDAYCPGCGQKIDWSDSHAV